MFKSIPAVKNYPYMLVAAATTPGVPYVSSPLEKLPPSESTPPPENLLLTRDLLAIAKFLVFNRLDR